MTQFEELESVKKLGILTKTDVLPPKRRATITLIFSNLKQLDLLAHCGEGAVNLVAHQFAVRWSVSKVEVYPEINLKYEDADVKPKHTKFADHIYNVTDVLLLFDTDWELFATQIDRAKEDGKPYFILT